MSWLQTHQAQATHPDVELVWEGQQRGLVGRTVAALWLAACVHCAARCMGGGRSCSSGWPCCPQDCLPGLPTTPKDSTHSKHTCTQRLLMIRSRLRFSISWSWARMSRHSKPACANKATSSGSCGSTQAGYQHKRCGVSMPSSVVVICHFNAGQGMVQRTWKDERCTSLSYLEVVTPGPVTTQVEAVAKALGA